MAGTAHKVVWGAVVALLGASVCGSVWAQDASAPVEAVPAPAPEAAAAQDHPEATYGPREASRDAYEVAEEQRRWAVNRQLQILDDVRWSNTWLPYVHRYALPYVYSYAPRRVARRVHREVDQAAARSAFTPWPQVPGDIYGYPYYPRLKQPIGHEQVRTGPNSYIYRPRYAPPEEQPAPTPAPPLTPTPAPPEPAPEPPPGESPGPPPAAEFPPLPAAEAIPVPPAESGPREF